MKAARLAVPLLVLPFAVVPALAGCGSGAPSGEPDGDAAPPNLILISIDTLRADRLGCYGYGRDTSPALDRFAEEAALFENAIAESSWTIPSHVTMLSGLYPTTHGVETPLLRASEETPVLAEILADAGIYTFAITGGGWLGATWGFDRGFRSFHGERQDFETVLARARGYADHRRERGPFFGFLHTFDVHCPYDPPESYLRAFASPQAEPFDAQGLCGNPELNAMELSAGNLAHLSDRYDAGIRWADDALGAFLDHLEATGLQETTIVVVTSDHGEELGEHGLVGHERTLRSESLRVPLLIRGPGVAPGRIPDPVGLADLVPTLLELLGLDRELAFDGRSLVPLLGEGRAAVRSPHALATARGRFSELTWLARLDSLMEGDLQLVVDRGSGTETLLDLQAQEDRGDAAAERPDELARLRGELERVRAELEGRRRAALERGELDAELRSELGALGYGSTERR